MREILFRGKDKDDGNWYEGYYLQLHDTTYCCMLSDKADEANRLNKENEHHYIVFEQMTDWALPNKHLRADVDPSTVCQYTGLTDKNGRKIFDGDIVRDIFNASVVGIVRYGEYRNTFNDDEHGGHVGFYVEWKEKRDLLRKDLVYWVKNSEFIGNTFDNPELIGE